VNPVLSLSAFAASPAAMTIGTSTEFAVSLGGGTFPYELTYTGLPAGCVTANSTQIACAPTVTGTFAVTVTATDAGGANASLGTQLVVNPLPSIASFTAQPGSVVSGTAVILAVQVSGGTTPYTYSYSGLPSDCAGSNASQVTCASDLVGSYSIRVSVSDVDGKSVSAVTQFTVTAAGSPSPSGGGSSSGLSTLDWVGIGVGIALVVIVVAVLVARSRRGPPGPPPAASSPATPEPGVEGDPAVPPEAADDNSASVYGSPPPS
jgi:hypothetical protein